MGFNIFTSKHTQALAERVVSAINELHSEDEALAGLEEVEMGNCKIDYFNNKEISPQYMQSIRDNTVYIFGHTGTNEIMEFALMIDAAKRASAGKIVAVVPSYGYARQDKKEGIRGPMGAKLVADILSVAGINSLITIDLHADAIQGFFNVPVNHVQGYAIFKKHIASYIGDNKEDFLFASPDAGGANRVKHYASRFDMQFIVMNKLRSKPGQISSIDFVGDVSGKRIIIIDDMVDTAGTLCSAAKFALEEKGAKSAIAICTHPILSGNAVEKIENSVLDELWISDTLNISPEARNCKKIKVITSSDILAKIIGRTYKSISMNVVNG